MKKDYENDADYKRHSISEATSFEQKLFDSIERLMNEQRVYCDPDLNRKKLAKMANSNSTYVGNAIRKMTGKQVNHYIGEFRLKEALKMIKQNPHIETPMIISQCGFSSKSTFYRKFTTFYQKTPKTYRYLYINE